MIDGGLPPPVLQHEVVGLQGCIWRLDFGWPELRVAAEYDGVDWRSGPYACLRDRRRSAALQDVGWLVVPIVAGDVRYRRVDLVRRLEARLRHASAA
jgi:very-short-patch-repair endonuclease